MKVFHILAACTAVLVLSACTSAPQSMTSNASSYSTLEPAAGGSYAQPPVITPVYSH